MQLWSDQWLHNTVIVEPLNYHTLNTKLITIIEGCLSTIIEFTCICSLMKFVHFLSALLVDAVGVEPVPVGSQCSGGVALLSCGSRRLMQLGTALETLNLNLTWRRNGRDFTPDSYSELVSHPCLRFSLIIAFCG
jgi:hypothetical protein